MAEDAAAAGNDDNSLGNAGEVRGDASSGHRDAPVAFSDAGHTALVPGASTTNPANAAAQELACPEVMPWWSPVVAKLATGAGGNGGAGGPTGAGSAPSPLSGAALEPLPAWGGRDSLVGWMELYRQVHVVAAPRGTRMAKEDDLKRFGSFFHEGVGHDLIDGWTPAVSRAFVTALKDTDSRRLKVLPDGTKVPTKLKPNSINRILATVRHFGSWLHGLRPLLAGDPFKGVKDLRPDRPAWRGLTKQQLLRLRAAVDVRLAACTRKNQQPHLEAAVFYTLLHTGLREHELISLDVDNYHHRGFHDVKRKGSMVTTKVHVPQEARDALARYLEKRGTAPGPLFMSARYRSRLTPRAVIYMCERLSHQACAGIKEATQHFKLTPHMLRHTFLKRVADKEGVHRAQEMSGNVGKTHIWRYTKPSEEEIEAIAEDLYA